MTLSLNPNNSKDICGDIYAPKLQNKYFDSLKNNLNNSYSPTNNKLSYRTPNSQIYSQPQMDDSWQYRDFKNNSGVSSYQYESDLVALPNINAMPSYISKLDNIIKNKIEDKNSITIVNPDLTGSMHMQQNSNRADNVQQSPLKKVYKAPLPFLRKGSRHVKSVPPSTPSKKYRYYSSAINEIKLKKSQKLQKPSQEPEDQFFHAGESQFKKQTKEMKLLDPSINKPSSINSYDSLSTRLNSCSQDQDFSTESFGGDFRLHQENSVKNKSVDMENKFNENLHLDGFSKQAGPYEEFSPNELEALSAQARAKIAMVDEQLLKLQKIQKDLDIKTSQFEEERIQWEKDKENQRLKLISERESFLIDMKKAKENLEKKKNLQQVTKEELNSAWEKNKELEEENQKLKLTIVELQSNLVTKDEKYKKIIDRLQNVNYLLERKNKSLSENLASSEHNSIQMNHRINEQQKFINRTTLNKKNNVSKEASKIKQESSTKIVKNNIVPKTKPIYKSSVRLVTNCKPKLSEIDTKEEELLIECNQLDQSEFSDILTFNLDVAWKPFDQALYLLNSLGAQEQVGGTIILADGRQEKQYKDGHKEIYFTNGLKKIVCPNGWIFSIYINGDMRGVEPTGYVYYYYHSDKIYNIQTPDGRSYNSFPDKQVDCSFRDGRIQVRFPNGFLKQIDPNGDEHIQRIK